MINYNPKSFKQANPGIDVLETFDNREELWPPGVACGHPGCFAHRSHPCEGCGRIGGFPDKRPILVGEANPYGGDPRYALYPEPERSAGGRLCRLILQLEVRDYLFRYDRRNLCTEKWSERGARAAATQIMSLSNGRVIVLLGSRVARAFEVEFQPFTVLNQGGSSRFVVLPHPSGLSRLWNRIGAVDDARRALREAGAL